MSSLILGLSLLITFASSTMAEEATQPAPSPAPAAAPAGGPVVIASTFTCRVDSFSARAAKSAKLVKRCDSMVDTKEVQIKDGEECKQRGLERGRKCIKASGADQIFVKVKVIEKVGLSSNINSYTCELDKAGGSACP